MGLGLQLRLLLWKNALLRKRHAIRTAVELIWPLFLFLILVLVRTRGLREQHHQCFFDEKALPSTGLLSFVQSFVCTFNNTCHENPLDRGPRLFSYNDSFINQLVDDLESALASNFDSDERVDALTTVFDDLAEVGQHLSSINARTIIRKLNVDNISKLFDDAEAFGKDLANFSSNSNISLDTVTLAKIVKNGYIRANFENAFANLDEFDQFVCNMSQFIGHEDLDESEIKATLSPLLCELDPTQANRLAQIVTSHFNGTALAQVLRQSSALSVLSRLNPDAWSQLFVNSSLLFDLRQQLFFSQSIQTVVKDVTELINQLNINNSTAIDNDESVSSLDMSSMLSGNISSSSLSLLSSLQRVICGRNLSVSQIFSDGGAATRFDQLRDQLKTDDDDEDDNENLYLYDNTTSVECNDLMRRLEENRLIKFLWDQLKPFIRGKILFTPDTPATRKLMSMVNETFAPIVRIRRLIDNWIDTYSTRVRVLLLDANNREVIKSFFVDDNNDQSLMERLLNNNMTRLFTDLPDGQQLLDTVKLIETLRVYFNDSESFEQRWQEGLDTLDNLAVNMSVYLDCFETDKFVGVATEYELEQQGLDLMADNKLWAGVVFLDLNPVSAALPELVQYKLRLDADKSDNTRYIQDRLSRPGPRRRPGFDLKYFSYGFIYLQDMIEQAIISLQSGRSKDELPGMLMQQMPYPCYIQDRFILAISRTFPLFMTLAFVYSASMIIKNIVHEKESRLKETMRVMGLNNALHWIAWLIDALALMTISTALLAIILTYGNILMASDPLVVFVFLEIYALSTITFCFLVSTLFSKANVAAATGGILFFCAYLPYSFMVVWEERIHSNVKIASCLVSNIAFGFGCAYFAHLEESGEGAHFSTIWQSPLIDDTFNLGSAMLMMFFDALLYFLLAVYIETVFPGQFGVPKPFYFFLTKSFWCGTKNVEHTNLKNEDLEDAETENVLESKYIEKEPKHLPLGVSIRQLSKVYNNGKVALEELSVNFYEDQITSFLGHNGAGKTTTISILTGLFPPSSGTARIYGRDIRTDMDAIRRSMGVCPQHNVLFEHLSVEEHLWFYARLKTQKASASSSSEIDTMIRDVGLSDKRGNRASELSGGMQRKLSIASAFIGNSKIVILDEPTAGVDPYSRRSIWDLLTKYKSGRTILLTTHFMDEADLLGDRIAIVNNGRLVCAGSSLFLRNTFGNGYYLTVVKDDKDDHNTLDALNEYNNDEIAENDDNKEDNSEDKGDESDRKDSVALLKPASASAFRLGAHERVTSSRVSYALMRLIHRWVPNASLLEEIGSEMIFVLPTSDPEVVSNFESLFRDIEKHRKRLRISSYGLSDTTLEEIFLKVATNVHDVAPPAMSVDEDNNVSFDLRQNRRRRSSLDANLAMVKETSNDEESNAVVVNRVRSASQNSDLRQWFGNHRTNHNVDDNGDNNGESNAVEKDPDVEEKSQDVDAESSTVVKQGSGTKRPSTAVPGANEFKKGWDKDKAVRQQEAPLQLRPASELFWAHMVALMIKRFHHSRRNKKGILAEIVLPAFFVCLAMAFTLILPPLEEQQPLELHPWLYPGAGLEGPLHTFVANRHGNNDWTRRYEQQLVSSTGMGTRCITPLSKRRWGDCMSELPDMSNLSLVSDASISLASCNCDLGTMQCPSSSELWTPSTTMASFDILHNLTNTNLSEYLLITRKEYRRRRYGGFELGVRNPTASLNFSRSKTNLDKLLRATNRGEARVDENVLDVGFGAIEDRVLSTSMFDNVRVWFNNKGWAASVAYLNAMNNVVLRASIEARNEENEDDFDFDFDDNQEFEHKDSSRYGIVLINHPMNFTETQLDTEVIRQIGVSLLHAICIIFALSFVPASFVLFHIEERVTKVKHLQFVSGVQRQTYWIAAFSWDMAMFGISAALCITIFLAFDAKTYVGEDNFAALIIILVLYGFASIPLMYPTCFVFSVPSSAFVTLSCANLFVGIITTVTTFVLENFEDDELKSIGEVLRQVFLIFPHYCLGRSLMDMATEYNINLVVARFGLVSERNRFDLDFLGKYMLCLLAQGIAFGLLTLAIEFRIWQKLGSKMGKKSLLKYQVESEQSVEQENEDEDVRRERRRIMNDLNSDANHVLTVRNLSKQYGHHLAVNKLCFGVRRGECFGLLGVNGAGKTTTFRMLTGDTSPSSGSAYVNNHSIISDLDSVRSKIGYCPQFDALNPLLTGREHLELFARLRGIEGAECKRIAEWGLRKMGLAAHADNRAGNYSGGNRRKLATAIALVGQPSIVFLDEPTTGMDPGARRFLWNCILDMVKAGQAVLLTSHSMEECEALCSRMGNSIMVNGAFQCLGSSQHLKSRFGSGYTLTLRSTGALDSLERLKSLVVSLFPLAELREEHLNQLQFQLPQTQANRLPLVFREMERAKRDKANSGLEDYSITQTTLDEVFIAFASKQTDLADQDSRGHHAEAASTNNRKADVV